MAFWRKRAVSVLARSVQPWIRPQISNGGEPCASNRSSILYITRPYSESNSEGPSPPQEETKKPERRRKKEKFGTYGWEIEDEINEMPIYEGHLYNARGIVDDWIKDSTMHGLFPENVLAPMLEDLQQLEEGDLSAIGLESTESEGKTKEKDPEGEGPYLRWETRMILGPGPSAWHPANRKVKVSVTVGELGLTQLAKERLLALVGKRYHPERDELTIISERNAEREENRKDVLRILLELIKEAKRADELALES